jgi:hypothetical protein
MASTMLLVILAAALATLSEVSGHSYHLGNCPTVESQQNFDMDRVSNLTTFAHPFSYFRKTLYKRIVLSDNWIMHYGIYARLSKEIDQISRKS